MSSTLPLSVLYEILVAESKYESRGIEYRTRLKSLYHQMLKDHETHNDTQYKLVKQSSNKFIEALSDTVRVVDPTEVQTSDVDLCYGIHQYVFPKIPDYTNIDLGFLEKWNKFYNVLHPYPKPSDRKNKRYNEKQKTYQMSKRRNVRDSESSSESDEVDSKSAQPVLITEDDFESPKEEPEATSTVDPHVDDEEEDGEGKTKDLSASVTESSEPEGHVKLPIVMHKEVEVCDDSIVFGVMDDERLTDWVSTSSFEDFKQLFKQIYFYDPTLKPFLQQCNESPGSEVKPECCNLDEFENTDSAEKDSFDFGEIVFRDDSVDEIEDLDNRSMTELNDSSSSGSFSGADETNDGLIGTSDFYSKSKVKTLPGNFKHDSEHFDPNSIFGNYYCPISPKRLDSRLKRYKRERQTPTNTTIVESLDNIDTTNDSDCLDLRFDELESELDTSSDRTNLMNLRNFTINFMEVDSTYSCNNTGNFEVRCSARIKDPFVSGVMKGKVELNMGLYQELQILLKKIFSLKRKITGNCAVCSGWNLLHGISQTFCEFCEDKLEHSNPELLLKIYEIRRYLVSTLYPIIGYNYDTLKLFNDHDVVKDWEEIVELQKVSIQSLLQVGSTFPKASLHDSRFLPTPLILPMNICNTINSFQYPKSNVTHDSTETMLDTHDTNYEQVSTPNRFSSILETTSSKEIENHNQFNYTINIDNEQCKENSDKKLVNYSLLEMVNYRRYHKAKALNDFFENVFNSYHSKQPHQRTAQIVNNYMNILKNGLLLSTQPTNPYNFPPNELDDLGPVPEEESVNKEDGDKDTNVKDYYFDENVSFILSKLPLDTDLIKLSFYHKGVFLSKVNAIKSLSFLNIGKIFGFKDNTPSNALDPSNPLEESEGDSDDEVNTNNQLYNYNWHELLSRNLNKKPFLILNDTDKNVEIINNLKGVDRNNPKYKNILNEVYENEMLEYMPTPVLNNLYNTGIILTLFIIIIGRIKIGFPTSLEMFTLNIPDSIMDCSLYGGVGRGFLYSLDNIIYNFSLLSPLIKVGNDCDSKKKVN